MSKLPYINLGCGFHFHKDWTNVDFISSGEGVIAHNLLAGIPFGDNVFEVAYHSHVLEHFLRKDADFFIAECNRVLKSGGVLRVAIPDLEQIARNYIKYLEESLNNVPGASEKYAWTMLEMYDQTVRTKGGGDMIEYIKDTTHNNDDFLIERNGNEAKLLIENVRNPRGESIQSAPQRSLLYKVKGKIKDMVLSHETKALEIGKFRMAGEIHQWMYDRYSLSQLLAKCNFTDIKVVKADESAVKDWNSFGLDIIGDNVRKPDSLFMEAKKK